MSGRICRETYANYGSYLRSRGYDKAICDLIDMIESGKIPVGPLWPVDKCNAILNGTLEIIECDGNIPRPGTGGVQSGMGQLWVQGGYSGSSSGPALARDLSIQAANGINTGGAIIQNAPANFTVVVPNVGQITDQNYLESNTILDGGLTMNALPSSSGVVFTPPKSVITDIINSNSSTSLPAAWSNGSIPDFPNDYTLATTKAIHDYVAGIAGVTHLSYNGNIGPSTAPQVHLTNEVFKIKGNTVSQSSSSYPQNIITEAQTNQELIIDLTKTGVSANTYGAATVAADHTQSINLPNFTVDQCGRLTAAGQSTAMNVMSSFNVEANTTPPTSQQVIENGGTLEFDTGTATSNPPTYDDNLQVVMTSSSSPASTVIEYKLSKNLKLESLLLEGTNQTNPPIVNEIVTSISAPGSDQKLATEKAIVSYVSAQPTGMTSWNIGADAPSSNASISNGDIVKIKGDSNNNIKTIRTSNDVEVELQKTLTKVNSITSENTQSLILASDTSTSASVINLNTDTSNTCEGVKINHALNIGAVASAAAATNSGDLAMAGSAAIGGDASIVGALTVRGDVTIGDQITDTLTINSTGVAVTNSQLANYNVLLINSSGVVKKSNDTADNLLNTASSLRYKENVEIMTEEAAADLMKIMPRTFNYKGSNDETFGLIAEELAGTELKAAVANDNEGRPDSINYSMLVAPLLRIVQDQNERIKALEEKVEALSK